MNPMPERVMWNDPETVPKDGSLIIILTLLRDSFDNMIVWGCRWDGDCWVSHNWIDVVMDGDEQERFLGWIPFPAIPDLWPHGPREEEKQEGKKEDPPHQGHGG
jgi:hypothetical protein